MIVAPLPNPSSPDSVEAAVAITTLILIATFVYLLSHIKLPSVKYLLMSRFGSFSMIFTLSVLGGLFFFRFQWLLTFYHATQMA